MSWLFPRTDLFHMESSRDGLGRTPPPPIPPECHDFSSEDTGGKVSEEEKE